MESGQLPEAVKEGFMPISLGLNLAQLKREVDPKFEQGCKVYGKKTKTQQAHSYKELVPRSVVQKSPVGLGT